MVSEESIAGVWCLRVFGMAVKEAVRGKKHSFSSWSITRTFTAVHFLLVDVLLRFRQHKVALTTDVSRMYRAVLLSKEQRDLHRFVWREDPHQPVKDYRMARLTFGVPASSFAANMALSQNAINHSESHPKAYQAVVKSFYVDDGLTGAASVDEAVRLRREFQELFRLGGFKHRKWEVQRRGGIV